LLGHLTRLGHRTRLGHLIRMPHLIRLAPPKPARHQAQRKLTERTRNPSRPDRAVNHLVDDFDTTGSMAASRALRGGPPSTDVARGGLRGRLIGAADKFFGPRCRSEGFLFVVAMSYQNEEELCDTR
jgi:hypothetical protein